MTRDTATLIVAALRYRAAPASPMELARHCGLARHAVRTAMTDLLRDGTVIRTGFGKYALPSDADPAA